MSYSKKGNFQLSIPIPMDIVFCIYNLACVVCVPCVYSFILFVLLIIPNSMRSAKFYLNTFQHCKNKRVLYYFYMAHPSAHIRQKKKKRKKNNFFFFIFCIYYTWCKQKIISSQFSGWKTSTIFKSIELILMQLHL